jgi:hypothetical protein
MVASEYRTDFVVNRCDASVVTWNNKAQHKHVTRTTAHRSIDQVDQSTSQ